MHVLSLDLVLRLYSRGCWISSCDHVPRTSNRPLNTVAASFSRIAFLSWAARRARTWSRKRLIPLGTNDSTYWYGIHLGDLRTAGLMLLAQ